MPVTRIKAERSRKAVFSSSVSLETTAPQALIDQIMRFNANPATRGAATRLLNNNTRSIIEEARRIAHSEFRLDRPESRRPPESRAHGRHYEESFFLTPATQDSVGRMTVTFGNDHPSARRIEKGTRPHQIPTVAGTAKGTIRGGGSGWLIFPYTSGSSRYGGPGSGPGDWPVATKGTPVRQVNHPGHEGFHILERAVQRTRDKFAFRR